MNYILKKHPIQTNNEHKVLVVVLDGVGLNSEQTSITTAVLNGENIASTIPFSTGNAVNAAYMPNYFSLLNNKLLARKLKAHGPSVGLPSEEDMGNSEVGHNALGAGRIFDQGAKLVNKAIETGDLFNEQTWKYLVIHDDMKSGISTLHLLGLFSDGNVHSHIDHLFALIKGAKKDKVKKVRLHLLLDGRDVPPTSALIYIQKLDDFLKNVNDDTFDCKVASGGGRMFVTMDRYDSDWSIVERGYNAHVLGLARQFNNITEAVETFRAESHITDQNLPPFVIAHEGKAIGPILDGDSVILFNFRGDRAIQISKALTEKKFNKFERKQFPKIRYAGMTQYDGDLKIPELFLVTPPVIDNTMGELLAKSGVKQFACSETQKFGHVTYFWNGNRSGKFDENLEDYIEIPSDLASFAERPWMKCAEITDTTIKAMRKNSFKVGRINFPNGDMVGHTGSFQATVMACSAVDLQLGRLMEAAIETNTILIVTADHGNADEMYEKDKKLNPMKDENGCFKVKTSHTLAPVMIALYNTEVLNTEVKFEPDYLPNAGLANVASTILELAGFEAPNIYEPSLLKIQKKNS